MKLPVIKIEDLNEDYDLVENAHKVEFFERDGQIYCADYKAVDYYGEFRGGINWIHEKLKQWADKNNCYWDWENPECIVLVAA